MQNKKPGMIPMINTRFFIIESWNYGLGFSLSLSSPPISTAIGWDAAANIVLLFSDFATVRLVADTVDTVAIRPKTISRFFMVFVFKKLAYKIPMQTVAQQSHDLMNSLGRSYFDLPWPTPSLSWRPLIMTKYLKLRLVSVLKPMQINS